MVVVVVAFVLLGWYCDGCVIVSVEKMDDDMVEKLIGFGADVNLSTVSAL